MFMFIYLEHLECISFYLKKPFGSVFEFNALSSTFDGYIKLSVITSGMCIFRNVFFVSPTPLNFNNKADHSRN